MKIITQFTFLLSLLLGFSSSSKAALLIEPVIGYNLGVKIEGDDTTDKGSGLGYGGRLGYQFLGFQIGADYLNSNVNLDGDWDGSFKMSEWGGFVGFEFPILLRVYGGYIFSAIADGKVDGEKAELTKGTGTKLGLGFTPIPFIDINIEFRQGKFAEYELGGLDQDSSTKFQAYFISLSLPFTL